MTWTTVAQAVSDLRAQLSDGPTDKLSFQKAVIGLCNGDNTVFKTFDIRRLSSFVTITDIANVYVNDDIATVVSEDLESGMFTLSDAPSEGDRVTATYYHQWFNDAQLTTFLTRACEWLQSSDIIINTPVGLIPCVLDKACAIANRELVVRYARLYSSQYRMEDLPKEDLKQTQDQYKNLADMYDKTAEAGRTSFYTRQDRNKQPLFGTVIGHVRDVKPNR